MLGAGGDGAPAAVRPAQTPSPEGEDIVDVVAAKAQASLHFSWRNRAKRGRPSMTTGKECTDGRLAKSCVKGARTKVPIAFGTSRLVESDRHTGPEPTRPYSV